jgi:hypothetical protein
MPINYNYAGMFRAGADLPEGDSKKAYDIAKQFATQASKVMCCAPVSDPDGDVEFFMPNSFGVHEAMRKMSDDPAIRRIMIYCAGEVESTGTGASLKKYLQLMPLVPINTSEAQEYELLLLAPVKYGAQVVVNSADLIPALSAPIFYDHAGQAPIVVEQIVSPGSTSTSVSLADMFEMSGHGGKTPVGGSLIECDQRSMDEHNFSGVTKVQLAGEVQSMGSSYPRTFAMYNSRMSVSLCIDITGGVDAMQGLCKVYGIEFGRYITTGGTAAPGPLIAKQCPVIHNSATAFSLANPQVFSLPLMVLAGLGTPNYDYLLGKSISGIATMTSVSDHAANSGTTLFAIKNLNHNNSSVGGYFVLPDAQVTYLLSHYDIDFANGIPNHAPPHAE